MVDVGRFLPDRAARDDSVSVVKVGLIGFGAIGRAMLAALAAADALHRLEFVSILVRHPAALRSLPRALAAADVTADFDRFIGTRPDLVVECAGHEAVGSFGARVLQSGTSLTLISVGALAEPAIEARMRRAAQDSGATLTIPAGAVGGLDLLATARLAGLSSVRYVSRKPPNAWRGTQAAEVVDLDRLAQPCSFFDGSAREAALRFPQNANVAAAIALAGLGFDDTQVSLTADPGAVRNEHAIVIDGRFGHAELKIAGAPLPDNPKSSWLAALSLARALTNASARVVI
jgi:aspartate dehydrogenase